VRRGASLARPTTSWNDRCGAGLRTEADLLDAIREGAVLRVRPKAMTVALIIAGLSRSWPLPALGRKSCSILPRRWWVE